MRVRCVCVCVMLFRPKMKSITKSRTHQDTERSESLVWEKWKSTLVSLIQLGVLGRSGTHPYRNKEQSMEECKYQALTADLTHKSSWTWTTAFVSFPLSRSRWTMCWPNQHRNLMGDLVTFYLDNHFYLLYYYGYKGRMPHSTFGQYFWLFINFFKTKITWTTIIQQILFYWPGYQINNYFKASYYFGKLILNSDRFWISLTSPYERSWHVFKHSAMSAFSSLEHGRWWNGSQDSFMSSSSWKGVWHIVQLPVWNGQ